MASPILIEITSNNVEEPLRWVSKTIAEGEEYAEQYNERLVQHHYTTQRILKDIKDGIIEKALFPADYIGY